MVTEVLAQADDPMRGYFRVPLAAAWFRASALASICACAMRVVIVLWVA